jgi:nicotinate-nucleotide adenylyltransferase
VKPLGLFGGTFDPIHFGHLRTAFELVDVLGLERVAFIPAGDPPHRAPPAANAALRLAMVEAAVGDEARFCVDDREIRRAGRSYTVLTLEELRRERGPQPLVLIVGMDAFAGLPTWHRWGELLSLAHIVVAHRPGAVLPVAGELVPWLARHGTRDPADLGRAPAGRVFVHAGTQLDIASTEVREVLNSGGDPRYLMPEAVRRMILDTGVYARPREDEG